MSFADYARALFEKLVANNYEHIKGLDMVGDEISYATKIIGLVNFTGSMWSAVVILNTNIVDCETYKAAIKPRLDAYFDSLLREYGKKNMAVLNLFVSEKPSDYESFFAADNFDFDRPIINIYWEAALYDKSLKVAKNHPDKIENLGELVKTSFNFNQAAEEFNSAEHSSTHEIYERAVSKRIKLKERSGPVPIATFILIIINMAIHAIIATGGPPWFFFAMGSGALVPRLVINGQYYRLFTSMFLHANFMHLLNNCFSLYIFGSRAERFYGTLKFCAIYLLSGIFGGIVSTLLLPYATIGASGAVFGLLGAVLALTVKSKTDAAGVNYPVMLTIAMVSVGMGFVRPEINNHAHIGGLLAGFIAGYLLFKRGIENE